MFSAITHKEDTANIKDIESLLKDTIKGKIIGYKFEGLKTTVESFGGQLLRVEVTIEENGQQEILHAIAKLIPPTEMQMEMINTKVTFKNEIAFYAIIVPLLQDFQREHEFLEIADYFPKLYGARTSLKQPNEVVDADGIILMQNLITDGYANINQEEGFDLDTAKQILCVLANFHSTAVGLKLKKKEIFFSKIRPYLTEFRPSIDETAFSNSLFKELEPNLNENPKIASLVPKIKKFILKPIIEHKAKEPWTTITHSDFWVNNIMLKPIKDRTSVKLVDFQLIDFGSPATDLIFFLFCSVQTSVLRYHFNKLVLHYYNEFIKNLQLFKINPKDFTYESFQKEMKMTVRGGQFHRSLSMLISSIFRNENELKAPGKIPEWNPNRKSNEVTSTNLPVLNHAGPPSSNMVFDAKKIKLPLACKERLWFITEEVVKQNWI